VARAGMKYMYDIRQFDCIDSSRNTTSLLLVLDQLNLLHHHDVDVPESRGHMFDLRPPHATAVLVEKATGTKWSIDSWTVGAASGGHAPRALEDPRLALQKAKRPRAVAGVFS
jgi:Zn-dependent membrane protease YugP